jgi:hypothetical protein
MRGGRQGLRSCASTLELQVQPLAHTHRPTKRILNLCARVSIARHGQLGTTKGKALRVTVKSLRADPPAAAWARPCPLTPNQCDEAPSGVDSARQPLVDRHSLAPARVRPSSARAPGRLCSLPVMADGARPRSGAQNGPALHARALATPSASALPKPRVRRAPRPIIHYSAGGCPLRSASGLLDWQSERGGAATHRDSGRAANPSTRSGSNVHTMSMITYRCRQRRRAGRPEKLSMTCYI